MALTTTAGDGTMVNAPNIQAHLDDVFNDIGFNATPTWATQYLMSEKNRRGIEQIVSPGGGKVRTVETLYQPRYLESAVVTDLESASPCTNGSQANMFSFNCVVDMGAGVALSESIPLSVGVTADTSLGLASIFEDNNSYIMRRVAAMVDGLDRGMENEVVTQLATLLGDFASFDTTGVVSDATQDHKTVTTKVSGDYSTASAMEEIQFTLQSLNQPEGAVFGGGDIQKYFNNVYASCCANNGLLVDEQRMQAGINFYPSQRTNAAIDAVTTTDTGDGFLVVVPGVAQIASVNLYSYTKIFPNGSVMTTITSPNTGVTYDLLFTWNCETLQITGKLAFTVCALPTDEDDIFQSGDEFANVNGLWAFSVTGNS